MTSQDPPPLHLPSGRYRPNLTLLTDLYQLTMAYGYWKSDVAETEAVFSLSFRKNPFQGGYTLACGLRDAVDYLEHFHFGDEDLNYLGSLTGNDGRPLFTPEFLHYLRDLPFTCEVDAIPEGTVIFPYEPLVRVQGPILQAQIVETALLTIINFQTLIATKASRVREACGEDLLLEYGLRRAQGIDGSLMAARAAYIGGCDGTSNVLASRVYGMPVRGTHAHSWVMAFESELEAFNTYADAMPNNSVLLVDTYNTLEGVRNAVRAGERLREKGLDLAGIRLDSGDLAYLSIEARKILDNAGFTNAMIFASNDLDEELIESLKHQGAKITGWGVGTKLVTAYDQPALGGVYKLNALRAKDGTWQPRVKLSEQTAKTSIPGIQQVRRFQHDDGFIADAIYDTSSPHTGDWTIVDPLDATRRRTITANTESIDLLEPIFRGGKFVGEDSTLPQLRERAREQVHRLHPAIRRFKNPHRYPVGLEQSLYDLRTQLILDAHGKAH